MGRQFPRLEVEEAISQIDDVGRRALPEGRGIDPQILRDLFGLMSGPLRRQVPLFQERFDLALDHGGAIGPVDPIAIAVKFLTSILREVMTFEDVVGERFDQPLALDGRDRRIARGRAGLRATRRPVHARRALPQEPFDRRGEHQECPDHILWGAPDTRRDPLGHGAPARGMRQGGLMAALQGAIPELEGGA
jgi:hypothetical protein